MGNNQLTPAQLDAWRTELAQLCRTALASAANELPLDTKKRIRVLSFILRRYDSATPEASGQVDLGHDPHDPVPPDLAAPAIKDKYDWESVKIPPVKPLPPVEVGPVFRTRSIVDPAKQREEDAALLKDLELRYGPELGQIVFERTRGYQPRDAGFPPPPELVITPPEERPIGLRIFSAFKNLFRGFEMHEP